MPLKCMGIGFAVNGRSVKYSFAYLWDEMLFHLYCLHIKESIFIFASFVAFGFDTFGKLWKEVLGHETVTILVDIPVSFIEAGLCSTFNAVDCLEDVCNQNISQTPPLLELYCTDIIFLPLEEHRTF